jgi:hypothetical protein
VNLGNQYIKDKNIDWNKTKRFAFNDRSNPDDDELGVQIVKDLHRTGCSAFSGNDNEYDRSLLKRVLLGYARYNKQIGYCQGFNIIAAFILEIVDKNEEDALLIMIYLIDSILPSGYYTNSMHTLAIDMVVFRELLRQKLPKLYNHLNILQNGTIDEPSYINSNYEPPLTNVFTMQWFLTLFATCLPKKLILRIWDIVLLDGIEILFRTALAIWENLSINVMKATATADSFYTLMSSLTIKLLNDNLINENELIEKIYSYGSVPLTGLNELREKYTFNIKPFQISLQQNNINKKKILDEKKTGLNVNNKINQNLNSNNSNNNSAAIDEDMDKLISCFALFSPNIKSTRPQLMYNSNVIQSNSTTSTCSEAATTCSASLSSLDISSLTPGAFSFTPQMHNPKPIDENFTLDINELKKQYMKLKQRQQQAQIIIQTASDMHRLKSNRNSVDEDENTNNNKNKVKKVSVNLVENEQRQTNVTNSTSSPYLLEKNHIYNHLLIKSENKNKNTLKQTISLTCSPLKTTKKLEPKIVDESDSNDDTIENLVFENTEHYKTIPLNELTLLELANIKNVNNKMEKDQKESELGNKKKTVETNLSKAQISKNQVKIINPFPIKPLNSMVAKNGIRLGLYK